MIRRPSYFYHGNSYTLKDGFVVKREPQNVWTWTAIKHAYRDMYVRVALLMWTHTAPGPSRVFAWWRHQMETFSALLAICAGNSPVSGEFPGQRPVTRNFDVLFDLRLNKRLSKQWWGWCFETLSHPLWRHCNGTTLSGQRLAKLSLYQIIGR